MSEEKLTIEEIIAHCERVTKIMKSMEINR